MNLTEVYQEQLVVELEELLSTTPTSNQVVELLAKYGYHQDPIHQLQRTKRSIGL